MALIGTMVRWYESHQLGPDIGHIPVSNLYEVFVLFCWMTAAFYLYFEQQYGEDAPAQVRQRTEAAHRDMPATLAAIRAIVEREHGAGSEPA